jgi:hypothetical protein
MNIFIINCGSSIPLLISRDPRYFHFLEEYKYPT